MPGHLQADAVHIWRGRLDGTREQVAALWSLLAADEITRANKFLFEHLRTRYVMGRGMLRLLLGHYLDRPAQAIHLAYGPQGKPHLPDGNMPFNLSHSKDLALYAFSLDRQVGIDVEQIRTLEDRDPIAERFFSAPEAAHLLSLDGPDQDRAFFECWTRKEAYIKAIGDGLTYPLDGFEVAFGPGRVPALLSVAANPTEVQRWHLKNLDPAPGFAGAVIVEQPPWQLSTFEFQADHWLPELDPYAATS